MQYENIKLLITLKYLLFLEFLNQESVRKTHVDAPIFIFKSNNYHPLSIIWAIFDVFENQQITFSQAARSITIGFLY